MLMGLAELHFQTVRVCILLSSCRYATLYRWIRGPGTISRCDAVRCGWVRRNRSMAIMRKNR